MTIQWTQTAPTEPGVYWAIEKTEFDNLGEYDNDHDPTVLLQVGHYSHRDGRMRAQLMGCAYDGEFSLSEYAWFAGPLEQAPSIAALNELVVMHESPSSGEPRKPHPGWRFPRGMSPYRVLDLGGQAWCDRKAYRDNVWFEFGLNTPEAVNLGRRDSEEEAMLAAEDALRAALTAALEELG